MNKNKSSTPARKLNSLSVEQKDEIIFVLLYDNAGGHNLPVSFMSKLTNVTMQSLPPNTTSVLQPCDAGIIAAFKVRYRAKIVRLLLKTLDEKSIVINIDVKQAIYFIREAWREVSSQTIENCWRKTKIHT